MQFFGELLHTHAAIMNAGVLLDFLGSLIYQVKVFFIVGFAFCFVFLVAVAIVAAVVPYAHHHERIR